MDMHKCHAGKLRAIGYDAAKRLLKVVLDDGTAWEYANVGQSLWYQLQHSSAPWSYYRDQIEDVFHGTRVSDKPASSGKNPLDDLFN